MTDTTICRLQQARQIVTDIVAQDYYKHLFEDALKDHSKRSAIESEYWVIYNPVDAVEVSLEEYIEILDNFWLYLPDTPSIRGSVFFKMCDFLSC